MFQRVPYAACPLCSSQDLEGHVAANCDGHKLYNPALTPEIYWLKCRVCSHGFTSGYWSEEAMTVLFGKSHEKQTIGSNMDIARDQSAQIIDKVLYCGAETGRWLDVGFGNGSLLFTALEYGFKPFGLELRPGAADVMRASGIPAECTDICQFNDDGRFNVISMADVLEHMPFPNAALKAARRLINDGGLLFVSCPNAAAPIWSHHELAGGNPYWSEIEHYHNFTRERLYALLRETGFTPLSYGVSRRYTMCMEVISRAV